LTPVQQRRNLKSALYVPYSELRQISVRRRFETGTSDQKRGRAQSPIARLTPLAQPPLVQGETDPSSAGASALQGTVASFGPFRLHATERILEKNGTPLNIGSRALDILITLLECAPEVVSKRELVRRTWGDLVVDEGSLRVHITALRKQLDDGDSSVSYVSNVHGRGYCFAGAVTWAAPEATPKQTPRAVPRLPREPLLMVGRDNAVGELAARLKKQRFVSIVGAGGIGKTTVVLALAHQLLPKFQGAVHFLDLATIEDPRLLASTLAAHLGLVSDQPLPDILTFLREQRLLLVFDNCEHVIGAIATLTENIFRDAPQVHILATSREALRAEGEQVHHLPPLECPPPDVESLTATRALSFAAVQLFVKQVTDSGHPYELTDSDVPTVAQICRRLDGIPLALELAASRVEVYGVQGTASLLDKHFRLLWHGRRTALPRHQTLGATLDWSYKLLSGTEQLVFRRLAIFVTGFSLAALPVASEGLDAAEVTEALATLVDKSLVTIGGATEMRYRLLETTRAYAWQKLIESGEDQKIAHRACEHLFYAIEKFGSEVWARPSPESIDFFLSNLSDLRAALDWCFSDQGDKGLGAKLTGASACLFLQAGLLLECGAWTERALGVLDASSRGTRPELELLACFAASSILPTPLPAHRTRPAPHGWSIMVTRGNVPAVHAAMVRALDIAERLKSAPMELYLLQLYFTWQTRSGDFHGLRETAGRIATVTKQVTDPLADAIGNYYLALSYFATGNNREVQRHAQLTLAAPSHLSKLNLATFEDFNGARAISAANLWVLGYPDQALMAALQVVQDADELNHPASTCHVLMAALLIGLETGHLQRADELIQRLSSLVTKHRGFTSFVGGEACLAVSRGDLSRGIQLLQTAIAALHQEGFEPYRAQFTVYLVEGLARAGKHEAAHTAICEAVARADTRGDMLDLSTLLRVKGEVLSSKPGPHATEAETCLQRALQLANEHGWLSLELRSGIGLARLWAARGEISRARALIEPIFSRFSEGFQTRDLLAAAKLLDELRSRA
jgi:predicted ATPase/DNA-binding winged helix-turn-helix (wHTH) protein